MADRGQAIATDDFLGAIEVNPSLTVTFKESEEVVGIFKSKKRRLMKNEEDVGLEEEKV